ncbi:MAG: phosphoribosylglycinamide formyltransferase [Oscillospiraceae bacterium]|jgi:phosphoribosylglycinamide formyltransferase-1|nr:phosphoribosylglycinamide formyltransferase [Oscillospiraceae bacterium]
MYKIAVLVSGTGTNFLSIAEAVRNGRLKDCAISCVISDRRSAKAIESARALGLPAFYLTRKEFGEGLSDEILRVVQENGGTDLLVLAGFLSILKGDIIKKFKNRIINIHPALIPSFCGTGMYGIHVHEAAIAYGVKITGCTVNIADGGTDTGPIVVQKAVPVTTDDPYQLQRDVLEEEHKALVEAIDLFARGRIILEGRRVRVL